MRLTRTLLDRVRSLKSLALSVHFKQPELGMKENEILSRATAYLVAVDPPSDKDDDESGPYSHLKRSEKQREERLFQNLHKYSQPTGPGRQIMDLGWLEFVPREVRPQVHIVASSHVLAPYLWQDYYPQEWLKRVRAEHCTYSLEVFDPNKPQEALAKLALNRDVFHHPEGRDIALIHLQEEHSSLKLLRRLGVAMHRLRDPDKLYQKGEDLLFDGFVVSERNVADSESFSAAASKQNNTNEDTRVFYPYTEQGKLAFHTNDRFFATTPEPLPEGLCGAPVLDQDGDLCGTVEGIVPVTHKDKRLAGSAAFLPSYIVQSFIDFVERGLLQQIMPKDLFDLVVTAKKTNSIGGGFFKKDKDGKYTGLTDVEEAYDSALDTLQKRYTPEEYKAISKTIEDERKEVLEIMDKEGGELDEIIARVRAKTLQIREMVMDQYQKGKIKFPSK
ncbi:hypothetical protein FisN_1Lh161 [Fistulifera solaris]|uniref:Uncharacterized protein n=1 Tax=Fistulifera solaris TaxID=1519565 RepID=A0A1Z5K530_FISSO|nr:hypothetical protein FisN_1Lh161 [Fistulifera solaris]|eukprot:GAX21326.1 hypothetical protein FisN_1Lh161 [Fistulifera solaris]